MQKRFLKKNSFSKRGKNNSNREKVRDPGVLPMASPGKITGMKLSHQRKTPALFERFANRATQITGSTGAFLLALGFVLVWAVTGPLFGFSQSWQLVINTGTTIITFLMVFLIQKSQNKDSLAVQLKLNELVASHERASNRLVDVESLTEEELRMIREYYHKLSELSKNEKDLFRSHSIDEAHHRHAEKKRHHSGMHRKKN